MPKQNAYEEQLKAAAAIFGAERKKTGKELKEFEEDLYGRLAASKQLTEGGRLRLTTKLGETAAFAKEQIGAEERMFLANMARVREAEQKAEEQRRKQSTRNIFGTGGTLLGTGLGAILAAPTGGMSVLAGAMLGSGLGGGLGMLGGGLATGEMEGSAPATIAAGVAAGLPNSEIQALRDEIKAYRDLARSQILGESY